MKAKIRQLAKILVLSVAWHGIAGCAPAGHSHIDVSTPSNQEFVEFDAVVNLPLATAYQNILSNAPTCWSTPFSGEILARPYSAAEAPSQISFVVPGKVLGSKVELASIRLYAHDQTRTRIVGSSFIYPGTWHLAELDHWTSTVSDTCSAPDLSS